MLPVFKLIYDESTYEIVDSVPAQPDNPPSTLVDKPDGFTWDERTLWKYDPTEEEVVQKTGQEYDDALALIKAKIASDLALEYTRKNLEDIFTVMGSMEAMLDCTNQIVQKVMNEDTITQAEKDAFNLLVNTCSSKFKLTLTNVTQAIADGMKAKKEKARDTETDMKNDPRWPYS